MTVTHGRSEARRRLRGTGWATVLIATSALVLGACGSSSTTTPSPDAVTIDPSVDASKGAVPAPVVPATWPLTGVAGEPAARPALAVKIENTSQARPQSGLDQADVVWETIVEFEVSRFVAVFHSQVPGEVGPIRSVRPMDPLIVAPLHGIFAFSGGQEGILDLVYATDLQTLSEGQGTYRLASRAAPHNLYASPQTLWDEADADHQAPPAEQFAFARTAELASAVVSGTPATSLAFRLSSASNPSWAWNGSVWLRSEGAAPATAASGGQLSAVNVVSVVADHPDSGFGAQNDASIPTYSLVGSGDAVVATGGKTLAVRWQKDAADAPLRLVTAEGASVTLAPGNTWVELVPAGSGSLTIG